MTEPVVPPQEKIPFSAQGDGSTSLWGGLFLPMGQGPVSPGPAPLPDWGPHAALLRDADPARFFAIDFLVWTLCFNLSQRLAEEGRKANCQIPQAVQSVGLTDPVPYMVADGTVFGFPLLSVYRVSSKPGFVSSTYYYRDNVWQLRYVLPGVNYEAANRLTPIFEAVQGAVEEMIERGYHPQYAPPGGTPGQLVFQRAGMMEVQTGDSSWEAVDLTGNGIVHPMLRMEWNVKVRRMDVRTAPGQPAVRGAPVPLAGTDATVTVSAEGGDVPPDGPIPVAQIKTDGPASGT